MKQLLIIVLNLAVVGLLLQHAVRKDEASARIRAERGIPTGQTGNATLDWYAKATPKVQDAWTKYALFVWDSFLGFIGLVVILTVLVGGLLATKHLVKRLMVKAR